ncbi:MAG: tryptophan--tRNA ligase [Candidatus Sumerlaeia bacterium]|nr:tryptophan--tRNA ligase [Candidatus Sumerlaeia bacterium]
MSSTTTRKTLLSGSRPTGRQHLGNYVGALAQWIPMQDDHDCFFMIADWHALTNNYNDTSSLPENIQYQVLDWMAVGLDPERATIFVQSAVKEHAELSLLLGMFTPLGLAERCTSWKDLVIEQGLEEMRTYGFLGYPVLQSADILMYQAHVVPVGKDQVEHIEKCQDLAQKVNVRYGEVFRIPQWKLSHAPVLLGNDGRKMSKSYNNCIYISESSEEMWDKIRVMVTDPARIRKTDPGNPEKCSVWDYHKVFTDDSRHGEIVENCTTAGWGCMQCKKVLFEAIDAHFAPARERRAAHEKQPGLWKDVLMEGNRKARERAQATMSVVREKLHLYPSNGSE